MQSTRCRAPDAEQFHHFYENMTEHASNNNRASAYLQNYSKDDGGDAFTNEEPLPAMETKGTIQQQQCCSQGTSYDLAQSCGCSDAGVGYPEFTSIQEQRQVVPHACMNDQHKQTHTCSHMNSDRLVKNCLCIMLHKSGLPFDIALTRAVNLHGPQGWLEAVPQNDRGSKQTAFGLLSSKSAHAGWAIASRRSILCGA